MVIRMGYWDCPVCERKRIEGPQRQCPECGRPRDDQVEFYTDDDAPEVTDQDLLQRADAGADWHCPFCESDNPAGQIQCQSCGASDPSAKQREVKYIPEPGEAQPQEPLPQTSATKSKKGPLALVAALVVLALLGAAVWFLFLRSKPVTVTITGISWSKTIAVENLETQTRSSWRNEVPSGAREISSVQKARKKKVQEGTKKVKVGKKDLGNGMFKDIYEERPNYVEKMVDDTWVTYKIDRWIQGRTLREQRSDGEEPPYPNFVRSSKKRAGKRLSTIKLALSGSDGKKYSYSYEVGDSSSKRKRAKAFAKGKSYTAMITAMGAVRELK